MEALHADPARRISMRVMLLVLVAITVVPLIMLLGYQMAREARTAVDTAERTVQDLAVHAAIETDASLKEVDRTLHLLAMRPQVQALDPDRCDPLFGEPAILVANTTVVASFDAKGNTVCSSLQRNKSQPINVAGDEWFRRVMASDMRVLGAPQKGRATGRWLSFMAVPIRSASGSIVGVVGSSIDLADFRPITGSPGLPENGVLAIVDRAGFVVTRFPDPGRSTGRSASDFSIGRAALAPDRVRQVLVGSDGTERVYAREPVAATRWVVVAGVPTSHAFQQLKRSLWLNGLGLMLTAVLIAVLVFAVYRRISQPLMALDATARAIENGDLTRRAAVEGPREFSDVAQSFNHMVDRMLGIEAALREREDQYRRLFLASLEAICVVGNGRILLANPAAVNLFGGGIESAVVGREFLDLVHPDDRAWARERVRGVLALAEGVVTIDPRPRESTAQPRADSAGEAEAKGDLKFLRADGAVAIANLAMLPFAIGGKSAVITLATDVSRRRRLEDELQCRREEIERLVNRQVAIHTALAIAHELNQPLGAVSAYSETALLMLSQGNSAPERLRAALERCVQQAHRAGSSLHELVRCLQQEDAPAERLDLASVIREALQFIRTERYDFDLKLQLADDIPPVIGRRTQTIKAIVNLLHNAVEATNSSAAPHARIAVTATATGDMAHVCIEDSGPGLESDAARQLFTPFFTTKPGGMGLGLVITRALIEAQGGHLWYETAAPQAGAAFHFTIPLAK